MLAYGLDGETAKKAEAVASDLIGSDTLLIKSRSSGATKYGRVNVRTLSAPSGQGISPRSISAVVRHSNLAPPRRGETKHDRCRRPCDEDFDARSGCGAGVIEDPINGQEPAASSSSAGASAVRVHRPRRVALKGWDAAD